MMDTDDAKYSAALRDIRFPELPYNKTDSVADLDALPTATPRKAKPKAAAVPKRKCLHSDSCHLRTHGKCDDLHCSIAAEFIAAGQGTASPPLAPFGSEGVARA